MNFNGILDKTKNNELLNKEELVFLLSLPPAGEESFRVMSEGLRVSKELSSGKAEIHGQFSYNLAPCKAQCMFCSFAEKNGIFTEETIITPEEAVASARNFEETGANAVYMMATAGFKIGEYLETAEEVKKNLRPETLFVANIGDLGPENAKKLKDAGFTGVYHALRLGEGTDTDLNPAQRKKSIMNFQEAGLIVGTCVEPIGPEHSNEELAEMILYTGSINPAFSGAARRISIPGTEMAKRGMISELRMAQIVAVTRLGVPGSVKGNCTHEPCVIGAAAGANLFWAEAGANPRDIEAKTEKGRGHDVDYCAKLFNDAEWEILQKESRFF